MTVDDLLNNLLTENDKNAIMNARTINNGRLS